MQQPFDPDRLEVTGEATPVVEQVFYNPGVGPRRLLGLEQLACWHSDPAPIARTSSRGSIAPGKLLETVGPPGNYRTPDLSPDGQRLAYADVNQGDVWIFDLSRQTSSRFTNGPGTETAPVWFPDGTKIAYRTDQGGMFEKDVTGTGDRAGPARRTRQRARPDLRGRQVDAVLCRHARRKSGRVRAAD